VVVVSGLGAARERGGPQAEEALERSRALLSQLTDPWERSEVLLPLYGGLLEDDGTAEEVLALKRETGDVIAISDSLNNIGWAALLVGDLDRAAAPLEEALAVARDLADTFRMTLAIGNLGLVAVLQGRYTEAVELNRDACSSVFAAVTGAAVPRRCSASRPRSPG
jgi:tetratricopeptide (TPR) repeat protein